MYPRMDTNAAAPHWRERLGQYWKLVRADRPIGWLLLLWPTWWGLWIAAGGVPPLWPLLVFSLGVWLTRSAGCVINDYADRWLDGSVERTRQRPMATGAVSGRALAAPTGATTGNAGVSPRQQTYLDGLTSAGVRRSTDLAALSIGSYICQGRAAGQTDQAVWDFVFPMVRGDLEHLGGHVGGHVTDSGQKLSARDATTRYLRIATERLC